MRCSSGLGDCNGGYFNGAPFRCSKCKRMPDGAPQPPELCEYCRVMHVPYDECPSVDEAGAIALMALQKLAGVEAPKEEALKGWRAMTEGDRKKAMEAYKLVIVDKAA